MSGRLPVPDVEKRPRDAATEALIAEALAEEEARKRARKAQEGGTGAVCVGLRAAPDRAAAVVAAKRAFPRNTRPRQYNDNN
jgi:hypothetical protein